VAYFAWQEKRWIERRRLTHFSETSASRDHEGRPYNDQGEVGRRPGEGRVARSE
jgi:hypothetical protein